MRLSNRTETKVELKGVHLCCEGCVNGVYDALKGVEITSLPVADFDIIPLNDADHGTNPKARGVIFLVSRSGFMQAIQENP